MRKKTLRRKVPVTEVGVICRNYGRMRALERLTLNNRLVLSRSTSEVVKKTLHANLK